MKILVLGSGLVGSAIAADLASDENFNVTVADISSKALGTLSAKSSVNTICTDLSDTNVVTNLSAEFDLVVSAVPGSIGHQTLKAIINARRNVVDITFAAEDFLVLDELAKTKGVTAISDIGVAPGMSNMLGAYLASRFDKPEKLVIYVGGLPKERTWPFEYKAVFSPSDLVEEYTRPARFVANGNLVVKPALTDQEIIDFEGIGSLEAFNSDGLRSLLTTLSIPDMVEKTLRYPGHVDKVKVLRDAGFLSYKPLTVNELQIRPADVTAKLLFPVLRTDLGEQDITIMRIAVSGILNGSQTLMRYDLFDSYDSASGVHSMARTTGYTATTAVRMLAEGIYKEIGVKAPEMLARDEKIVQFFLSELEKKSIYYKLTIEN